MKDVNARLPAIHEIHSTPVPTTDYFMKAYYAGQRCSGEVLDIGCNTGYMSGIIHSSCKYTSLEINKDVIGKAKEGTNIKLWDMISRPWPFADSFFDTVLWLEGPETLIDPTPVYSEIFRVIKPSGTLVLAVSKFIRFTSPVFPKMYEYDLAEILKECQDNKLTPVNYQEVSQSNQRLYRKLFLIDCKPVKAAIIEKPKIEEKKDSSEIEIFRM